MIAGGREESVEMGGKGGERGVAGSERGRRTFAEARRRTLTTCVRTDPRARECSCRNFSAKLEASA